MAQLLFGETPFDAGLVVFDKDGTLIDFDTLWAGKLVAGVERLLAALDRDPAADGSLRTDLYRTFGYDATAGRFFAQGPVITASMPTLYTIAATVLAQHGWGWLDAELLVHETLVPAMAQAFGPHMLRPLANLPALFGALRGAGVLIAVVTSDDESPTRHTLEILGLERYVSFVAGADSGFAHKPAPHAVLAACAAANVPPQRTAVVGDSTTDMLMAQRAGAGLAAAVLTGHMGRALLAPSAQVVLNRVDEIRIHPQSGNESTNAGLS